MPTRSGIKGFWTASYLDSQQETKTYILLFRCFWFVFGESWAQECAQRPRLEKPYINQQKLSRNIDSKAPRQLKSKIWPGVQVKLPD